MRMTFSQPSVYLVILTPLDREAKAWYHTLVLDGYPAPRYLRPDMAHAVVDEFIDDGGELVSH